MPLVRGALIEYGTDLLGPIPNVVIFQFNPESLSRSLQIPQRPTGPTQRETTQAGQKTFEKISFKAHFSAANMLDKDLWVNVPHKASDDYVRNLAQLLKDNLEPDRVVYVEYSNEVWNGIFDQNGENLAMAVAEVNSPGGSPLNADGETNQIYWGWRRRHLCAHRAGSGR